MKTQIILTPINVRKGGLTFDLTLCSEQTVKELSVDLKAGDCIKRARQAVKPHVIYQLQRSVTFNDAPQQFTDGNGAPVYKYQAKTHRTNNGCLVVAHKSLTHSQTAGFLYFTNITVYASLNEYGSLYAASPDLESCDWVEYSCRISWG